AQAAVTSSTGIHRLAGDWQGKWDVPPRRLPAAFSLVSARSWNRWRLLSRRLLGLLSGGGQVRVLPALFLFLIGLAGLCRWFWLRLEGGGFCGGGRSRS